MTFVLVGGGPTGVELAGALGEIAHDTLKRDFRSIRSGEARIILVEAMDRVLPPYPPGQSASAQRQLEKLGVEVRTSTRVVDLRRGRCPRDRRRRDGGDDPGAHDLLGGGCPQRAFARTVAEATGAATDRSGRIVVEPDLTIPGHPEIFVVGDAAVEPWKPGKPTPGVAQGAMQGGSYAAKVVRRRILGRPYEPYQYSDHGDVAVIGRLAGSPTSAGSAPSGSGAGSPPGCYGSGSTSSISSGSRTGSIVLIRWAWTFVTHGRGTRLITGSHLLPPIVEPEPPVMAPLDPEVEMTAGTAIGAVGSNGADGTAAAKGEVGAPSRD